MLLAKTHGCLNEVVAVQASPADFPGDAELRRFVRRACDRSSWTGGSGGICFFDPGPANTRAWFFRPDGTPGTLRGHGLRGLGRLLLDLRGTDTEVIAGVRDYAVHRAASTPEGVRQVRLELPEVAFAARPCGPFDGFTSVTAPDPHVVTVVEEYSERELVAAGEHAAQWFPEGADVSFLLPLESCDHEEVFVRTFERDAGLTPSCGAGIVAARAAYSRITGLDPREPVLVRNPGGVATASIDVRDSGWHPVLEGNGTIVYRSETDAAGNQLGDLEWDDDENAAYQALDECNLTRLDYAGVTAAHPAPPAVHRRR